MAVSVTSCDAGGIPVTTTARGSSSCDTMSDRSSGALAGGGKREGAIADCTHHRVCKPARRTCHLWTPGEAWTSAPHHTQTASQRRGAHDYLHIPCRACTATREHDTDVVCWPSHVCHRAGTKHCNATPRSNGTHQTSAPARLVVRRLMVKRCQRCQPRWAIPEAQRR